MWGHFGNCWNFSTSPKPQFNLMFFFLNWSSSQKLDFKIKLFDTLKLEIMSQRLRILVATLQSTLGSVPSALMVADNHP